MKKLSLIVSAFLLSCMSLNAQTSCVDQNGYVASKNSGPTGYYTLNEGAEEMASQTYYYSGPGKINGVHVHGNYPGATAGVPLRVGVYHVDANGRPTTQIYATNATWWWFDNAAGYINVNFGGGGVFVNSDFAITVEIRNASPWGETFQVKYTGDGEGNGEDLASLAGTSTGFNWSSAMTAFSKDGDFYLEPRMTHFMTPEFIPSTQCVQTGVSVSFDNETQMTTDGMFNTIGLAGYSGSNTFYSWNFGDGSPVSTLSDPTHSYSTAGVYTVSLTVTIDGWGGNCTAVYTKQISVGLNVSASTSSVSCFGGSNGTITASVAGGATPFQYSIDGSTYQSGTGFTGLPAGTYNVYVKDNLGCEDVTTVTIAQPSEIVISDVSSTNASCGTSNGSLLVTASGGTGALQYQLNSGTYQASNSFGSLPSGLYTVNVKDANNCISTTQTIVADQGAPDLHLVSYTNISCYNANDGTIILLASGGSGQLQYSINGGTTWQTGNSFLNLPAGPYYALVKDAAGCTDGFKLYLSQPDEISFDLSSTSVSCNGGNDGTVTVGGATGGTGNFSYSINGTTYQSGNVFTGLSAATYTVYAKDVANCIQSSTIAVTQPTALLATTQTTPADCYGSYSGTITVNATGGTGAYTYSLNGEDFQSDNLFEELEAGGYSVIVTDANGCEFEVSANVAQPTAVTASITTGSSTCGNTNGTMLVVGSGGSGSGYQYSLDGSTFVGSGSFNSLAAGSYYVVVRDGSGCSNVFQANINDADGPSITSISNTDVSCNGGDDATITVNTVTGGTGALQYSINGTLWQSSPVISSLEAGTYVVLVKDANGCIGESTVVITEPAAFTITANVTDALCFDGNSGSVTVNAAGGAGTLAYSIDGFTFTSSSTFGNLGEGDYTIIVRDAAGCRGEIDVYVAEPLEIRIFTSIYNVTCNASNDGIIYANGIGGTGSLEYSIDGSTYQSSGTFAGLDGGIYVVLVRDDNGCIQTKPVYVIEPAVLSISSNVTNVSCTGGDNGVIDLSVSGGIAPYSFNWSNFATTEDNFNLAAGNYSVDVTDYNGCLAMQAFVITEPTNPLIVNGVVTNATGAAATDGSVDVTVTGGSSPYDFDWSNGAITEDISGVVPGVYSVTVTDDNGCASANTFVVSYNVGIDANEVQLDVQVYPNPARDFFTIDAGANRIQQAEILNVVGEVVYTGAGTGNKVQMSTETLATGLYMVRVYVNDNTITKRIYVVR